MFKAVRFPIAVVCAAIFSFPCFSQSNATFTTKTSGFSGPTPMNLHAVDVNNDGIPDLIQDSAYQHQFRVYLANGDGTFRTGFSYVFPSQFTSTTPMVSGDFNGDGKVDLVFRMDGSNQIAVFLGKQDGTFQAPTYETLPVGSGTLVGGFAAADFTGDGKLDLVTEFNPANTDTSTLYLLPGDGTGHFGSSKALYSVAAHSLDNFAAGDFDADGMTDLVFTDTNSCQPGTCVQTLHVMYGTGGGNFTDTTPYTANNNTLIYGTGDLNSDGRTDIYGAGTDAGLLVTLYGQTSRTFSVYTQTLPDRLVGFTMADFNGDGRMDLATVYTPTQTDSYLVIYLATTSPGAFTRETYRLPYNNYATAPVAGHFNRDAKPDVAAIGGINQGPNVPLSIVTALDTTSSGNWGGCAYPGAEQGIHLCTPSPGATTGSTVTFKASANSFGQLHKIELWVDGKKTKEEWHNWENWGWFNFTGTFAAGTHNAAMIAGDVDNRLQKYKFTFTVGSSTTCSAPSSAGVHVCSPVNGSTVSSPVKVLATGKVSGTFSHMELWVDGVKKYSESSSTTLNANVSLAKGKHKFGVFAVNTAGTKWNSVVYATVQ